MSIESVTPSNHLILSSPSLPTFNLPSIRVFSNESALCISWPKYWSFSFSISPSNEYSGLISFRMDWLDLFAVQGIIVCSLDPKKKKNGSVGRCSSRSDGNLELGRPRWVMVKAWGQNMSQYRWFWSFRGHRSLVWRCDSNYFSHTSA